MRIVILSLILVSATASASLIEDTTRPIHPELYYQEDGAGHTHGDAPDACLAADAAWTMDVGAEGVDAMLVQTDDEVDAFITPIAPEFVGQRMQLEILPSFGLSAYELAFDILDIGCQESVFDPEASYYNRSKQVPPEPVAPGPGQVAHTWTVGDHACEPSEWKFMLQNTQAERPAELYVEYSDASYEYVPLHQGSPSNVAKYHTSTNLEYTVTRVMAAMPAAWTGSFIVAHGPCDVVEAPAVPPPVQEPLSGNFTVVEAGDYVLLVSIHKDAIETTQETVEGLVPPPSSIQVRCDRDICSMAFAELEYDAFLQPKEDVD